MKCGTQQAPIDPASLEVGELVLLNISFMVGEFYPTGADVWENCIITDINWGRGQKIRRRKRYPRVEAVRFLRPCGREVALQLATLEDLYWNRALAHGQRHDRKNLLKDIIRHPE